MHVSLTGERLPELSEKDDPGYAVLEPPWVQRARQDTPYGM